MTFPSTEQKAKFRHHNYELLIEIREFEVTGTGRCFALPGHREVLPLTRTQGGAPPHQDTGRCASPQQNTGRCSTSAGHREMLPLSKTQEGAPPQQDTGRCSTLAGHREMLPVTRTQGGAPPHQDSFLLNESMSE